MSYTYIIKQVDTNTFYYGCRYATNCDPSELWTTYFTSSMHVNRLIEQYGKASFIIQIRKIFTDINKCRNWEHKVLRRMRVVERTDFLNKTDNKSFSIDACLKGTVGRLPSTKVISSAYIMGKSNAGKTRTGAFKRVLSERSKNNKYRLGKKDTDETKLKKIFG